MHLCVCVRLRACVFGKCFLLRVRVNACLFLELVPDFVGGFAIVMMLLLHYLVMSAFRDTSWIVRGHCLRVRQL